MTLSLSPIMIMHNPPERRPVQLVHRDSNISIQFYGIRWIYLSWTLLDFSSSLNTYSPADY